MGSCPDIDIDPKYKAIDSQFHSGRCQKKKEQYLNAYSMESWEKTAQGKKNYAPSRRMQMLSLNNTSRE